MPDLSGLSSKEIVGKEMHRFKHGELHSGPDKYGHFAKDRNQAIAIALHVAGLGRDQRSHHADGGAPWFVRQEARGMVPHTGAIRSPVAGRTDHIPLNVPNGSYVLPADHVSHLGQNNTDAGHARLDSMFSGAPFGAKMPSIHHGRGVPGAPGARAVTFPAAKTTSLYGGGTKPAVGSIFAAGGVTDGDDDLIPIMAAGGEYVLSPTQVANVGHAALIDQYGKDANISYKDAIEAGHSVLDGWVQRTKPKHIKALSKLPGPAK